jgi:hypothetical protein
MLVSLYLSSRFSLRFGFGSPREKLALFPGKRECMWRSGELICSAHETNHDEVNFIYIGTEMLVYGEISTTALVHILRLDYVERLPQAPSERSHTVIKVIVFAEIGMPQVSQKGNVSSYLFFKTP